MAVGVGVGAQGHFLRNPTLLDEDESGAWERKDTGFPGQES